MRRSLPILVLLAACPSSSPSADLQQREASGDRATPVDLARSEARRDLGPDRPKAAPHWETVAGASLSLQNASVTLLQSGEVLIVGGERQLPADAGQPPYLYLSECHRYLPATGELVSAGSLALPRTYHAATLLADGRVLVTGGERKHEIYLKDTEIYDPGKPAAAAWSQGPPLSEARHGASPVLLPGGTLLLFGGSSGSKEALDTVTSLEPGATSWKLGVAPLKEKRRYHAATLLADGRVLLSGGARGDTSNPTFLGSLELYDPKTGSSSLLAATMSRLRSFHSATRLDDGRVLFVGGYCGASACGAAVDDLYDPKTDTVAPVAHPGKYLMTHVAVKLLDGRVLITGNALGADHQVLAFAPSPLGWEVLPKMPHPRDRTAGTILKDGSVLIAGGVAVQSPYTYASELERFYP